MDPYSGDSLITDLGDGGDLTVQGGQPKMSSGLENAAYLSLFVDADWWGNDVDPTNPGATGSRQFIEVTRRAKLTPDLLKDAKSAAEADLAWMVSDGVAKSVTAECSIVAVGVMGIELTIVEPDGTTVSPAPRWTLNWARLGQEVSA